MLICLQHRSDNWFLPIELTSNPAMRKVIEDLLMVMRKREDLEQLQATKTTTAFRRVLDAVINDSCSYVSTRLSPCVADDDPFCITDQPGD